MNKRDAKLIAETITNEQLADMFSRAKAGISDWTKVSSVNPSMTKGTAWNILHGCFAAGQRIGLAAKANMIWEYGDFLPDELKPAKRVKATSQPPHHQDPVFSRT